NETHGITPATIKKSIREILASPAESDYVTVPLTGPALLGPTPGRKAAKAAVAAGTSPFKDRRELLAHIEQLRETMRTAARELRFEEAAKLRDRLKALESLELRR
ncbi:MAG: UvrB/UvrC motif-containing protein, partial [Planctomycetota bacterium]